MILYKDIFTDDELCTDVHQMVPYKDEKDQILIRFKGKYESRNKGGDYDIGANASEEDPQQEAAEDGVESGVNIVLDNRLQETSFDKKSFQKHIKEYMKNVFEKLAELYTEKGTNLDRIFGTLRADTWEETEKNLKAVYKSVVAELIKLVAEDEFTYFVGSSFSANGMTVLVQYDGDIPYVILWKHGVIEEKL